ncbi:MAG: ATP-dependent DNA helicase, partial [Muribaculaceae bacterium]|nr:ATP-dependent DNA helicase [Muribaculaceae bacterium]
MTDTPVDILKRYWGHSAFRPMQSEIIGSVLSGADTLGLLPTGGGKSVTFQVPALMLPGITLVVTPLISLMKDQVDNLRAADITAACLHSGMSRAEQRLALQKAALGRVKLLYISPEKLCTPRFADELRDLDVSLIVVDEAHCISQWGYDFRPSYLRIAQLRERFHEAPMLALTASATPEVVDDICTQLRFRDRNAIFRRSFARPNISYVVRHGDNKPERLLRVLRAVAGSGIVYVRSRRRTRELAEELRAHGISAEFYHAGLAAEEKTRRQQQWKEGITRVMVATNAFGMGIDKPDVRVVVHYDLPSSVEEYYQEAGRAGRDGRPSFAVALVSPRDKATLRRRIEDSFPPKEFIAGIYDRASVFVDLSIGEGDGKVFDFNFDAFCHQYSLRPAPVRAALGILTRAGYVEFDEDTDARARVMIVARKEEIYGLRLSDNEDEVLQHLLRNCPGIFADFVQITEAVIASDLRLTPDDVYHALLGLARTRALV